jgi:hypothetical protein
MANTSIGLLPGALVLVILVLPLPRSTPDGLDHHEGAAAKPALTVLAQGRSPEENPAGLPGAQVQANPSPRALT